MYRLTGSIELSDLKAALKDKAREINKSPNECLEEVVNLVDILNKHINGDCIIKSDRIEELCKRLTVYTFLSGIELPSTVE